MKLPYDDVHLIADPLYGYTRITVPQRPGEVAEADIIDNPWVQRLKRIHQLQSSWWVFPTAEHSRFSHSLGTMHLAGELAKSVYATLSDVEHTTPSLPVVEETLRLAGLLHDVGHGPFGHFLDEEYLYPKFGLDHELLSQRLIIGELGDAIAGLRRSPSGNFGRRESVDPEHVAYLIRAGEGDEDGADGAGRAGGAGALGDAASGAVSGAAKGGAAKGAAAGPAAPASPLPRWVRLLHLALSGAITVDNMDYVRRDAYMCGVAIGAVDVDRLLYYTFVTHEGITYHKRALGALRAFLNARFYMYENVYFHRIGRAIDLHLREVFRPTLELILPESPFIDPEAYRRLTEWSLFTQVERWLHRSLGTAERDLAEQWQAIIHRDVKYRLVFEQSVERQQPAPASRDFTRAEFHEAIVRALPKGLKTTPFEVDIASQDPRPTNPMRGPKRIHVYDPASDAVQEQLLSGILEFVPAKAHLYRVFAVTREHERDLAAAARAALGEVAEASLTNL